MSSPTVVPLRPELARDRLAATPGADLASNSDATRTARATTDPVEGAGGVTPLSAAQVARLTAWRELNVRWPVHLLMALVLLMSQLLPEAWRGGGGIFALIGVVIYAVVLGLGSRARDESFWVGLGGAAAVREAAATLVEFGLVGLALLLVRGAESDQVVDAARASFGFVALAGFSRAFAATWPGRLLVVAGMLPLSAVTLLPSYWIAKWPLVMAMKWRLVALVGGALVMRVLWARRHPPTAAGRTRRRLEWTLLPLATGLVSVVELAWTEPVGPALGPNISGLVTPVSVSSLDSGQRVWWFDGDDYHALPLRGPLGVAMRADSGAVVYESAKWFSQGLEVGLMAPDGDQRVCDTAGRMSDAWVADDGRSATILLDDRSLLVVDVDAGCSPTQVMPASLPLFWELANRERAAKGRPLFTLGEEPGTLRYPTRHGVRIYDLAESRFR